MMKRLVAAFFYIGVSLLIACLVAPSFIDWTQHKDKILAQISPYFQRRIDVAGNVSFRILPQPEITLESVTVANAAGAKTPSLLTLKSLEARIRLEPLLEGRVEVETVNLVEPVLNLEVFADGKEDWQDVFSSAESGLSPAAVQLNEVKITRGTLHYLNQVTGIDKTAENLNLTITAETLLGPYRISGDMPYQKTQAKFDIDMGAYDRASTPVHMTFKSAEGLPQLDINGALDLQAGIDIQGEVKAQGDLSRLLDIDSLNALRFMHDNADLTGIVDFKGGQFNLNDIKAKFGDAGALKGKMSVRFAREGKPSVTAELEGNNLMITDKRADDYMPVPGAFDGSLHFKGRNIGWDGGHLVVADITTSFNQQEWAIKSAQVSLPGNTQIKLAGTVMPKTETAAYTAFQLTTDDLAKMIDTLAPSDNNIFKSLGGTGPVKKLALTGTVQISPVGASLYNIDATIGEKTKVSGVLNIDRSLPKQNFTAKLHFTDLDDAAFPAASYDAFLQAIMKSTADMELTAKNFTKNGLKIADISFKGKTGEQGLEIQDLSGSLSEKEAFSVKGHATTLAPLTGMDISYVLKATHPLELAKALNIDVPPVGMGWENADLKGTLKGDAQKYAFTAQGGADDLTWQGQHIQHPVFSLEADPASVKVTGLGGDLWGGKLDAGLVFLHQDAAWSSAIKGSLKRADLHDLQKQLGFDGFTVEKADLDMDLASPDGTLANAAGNIGLKAGTITIEKFNFDKLASTVRQITEIPANLQKQIDTLLRDNGAEIFKETQGHFKLDHGKIAIEDLSLSNAAGKMNLSGSAEIGAYNLTGELSVGEKIPALKVQRTSEMPDYTVDTHALEAFVIKNIPAVSVPAVPVPPPASTPVAPPSKAEPIKDILKRLDEGDVAPPAPPPPAPLAPPPQPDVKKELQKMEMQELLPPPAPKDENAPTPLRP
jgi:uncharacterized protein involved in outer membrane biogenesis